MLSLRPQPTLVDFQKYAAKLEEERGFTEESLTDKCLLLGEEVGELYKAVRKSTGIKVDQQSREYQIESELADVFIYVLHIANKAGVDLEGAFRAKEEKNKQRVWKTL